MAGYMKPFDLTLPMDMRMALIPWEQQYRPDYVESELAQRTDIGVWEFVRGLDAEVVDTVENLIEDGYLEEAPVFRVSSA